MGALGLVPGQVGPASALGSPSSQADWRQFHFSPNHAGLNPFEVILNRQNVSGLELAWSFDLEEDVETAPAVVDGILFIAGTFRLVALDAATGQLLWTKHEFLADWSEPTVWRGRLFEGSARGVVRALDARTGTIVWSFFPGDSLFNLTVADDKVFFSTVAGRLYALDARDGHQIWRTDGISGSNGNATVVGGVVYTTGNQLGLTAVDEATGSILWRGVGPTNFSDSTPAVSHGLVYIGAGSPDHHLHAYAASGCGQPTCSPVWTAETGREVDGSASVGYGSVFVGANDGNLYAFDPATGAQRWVHPFGGNFLAASPVLAGGVLFTGADDQSIHAIDPVDGTVLWSYQTGGQVGRAPAVVNGWLYVGSFDSKVYAFHLP